MALLPGLHADGDTFHYPLVYGGIVAGPFYFAWVDENETTFTSAHYRMDEYIFSAKRVVAEGEKPLLEIEIQNPHVGILNPTRKYWAWFSWDNGTSIVPLFFGRVVGTPAKIFEEVITLQFVADPIDYTKRVQTVADTLKYRPFYDQVFIDVGKRDDPNTILEAHAKVWDVNPVTHAVTANDIITGDSNEDFTADDHFYDSMEMSIGQPPATAILMDASVSWTQTARGIVNIGNYNFKTLSTGILSDWPKPLAQLGGGWSVFSSEAYDTSTTDQAVSISISWSWQNTSKHHSNGDTMSVSGSLSTPMGGIIAAKSILTYTVQSGVLDPFATDEDGDPSPLNIPSSVNATYGYIMSRSISASLTLEYIAERPRTERVIFLVRADSQPVLSDPTLSQDSETLTMSGADVGVPIINLLNWTTVSGGAVSLGQIIFPDNPDIPGGRSAQIAVVAGTAGTETPAFSDIPGFTTVDGTVTWSSLGVASPTENAMDWTPISNVNLGTIILPKRPRVIKYNDLIAPGVHAWPPTTVSVSEGTYVQYSENSFGVVIVSGIVGSTATITPVNLPSGTTYFICTTAGVSGAQYAIPPFNNTLHSQTIDNTVVWTSIGSGEIPAGGVPGDVRAATYFAQDRGRQSLEYLGALVRARLLWRSRCIEITFECEYLRGVDITTRKTVTLHDPRIAGGVALGKVKSAELMVSDTGLSVCRVTIACCAGLDGAVSQVDGDPLYVDAGYVATDYQLYENVTTVLPTLTDLSYEPPLHVSIDDGLTFPLTRSQIVLVDRFHAGEGGVADAALKAMKDAAILAQQPTGSLQQGYENALRGQLLGANSLDKLLKENPSWQEFQFKPVNSGPFHKVYNVKFSKLQIPMGIDLQSETTT